MIPSPFNQLVRQSITFDVAMMDLSLLYDIDNREFIEQFNQWIAERPISWYHGVEILRVRFGVGAPLPWIKQVGPSEYK